MDRKTTLSLTALPSEAAGGAERDVKGGKEPVCSCPLPALPAPFPVGGALQAFFPPQLCLVLLWWQEVTESVWVERLERCLGRGMSLRALTIIVEEDMLASQGP